MFGTESIYNRMGTTYTGLEERGRASDVDVKLASIKNQLERSREKFTSRLATIQGVVRLGNYFANNLTKYENVQKGAKAMGATAIDGKPSLWRTALATLIGPSSNTPYQSPAGLNYSSQTLGMVGAGIGQGLGKLLEYWALRQAKSEEVQ